MKEQFLIRGIKRIDDNLSIDRLVVQGYFRFRGHLQTKVLRCEGIAHLKGGIDVDEVFNDGRLKIKGKLAVSHLISTYYFKGDEVNATYVDLIGQAYINNVQCQEFVFEIRKRSRMECITAHKVKVNNRLNRRQLIVNTIQAETIDLDCVKANVIKGKEVDIGPHCQIKRVQYTDRIRIDPLAKIQRIEKIDVI